MSHSFSQVPRAEIQRSSFDRSHGYKTTFDSGYLIPVFVDEALPGDTFRLNMNCFARLATPLKPFMDNMFLDSFFFAVPIRLIWNNWERFNGAQDDPTDSTDFFVPQMQAPAYGAGGIAIGSLSDYFGLPAGPLHATNPGITFNSLWHRSYSLIWNEWFRDQNLQNSVVVDKDDGPDTYSDYVLLKRGKRHDYFTSSLPWPQKGPDVLLPLGDEAPVLGIGKQTTVWGSGGAVYESGRDGTTRTYAAKQIVGDGSADLYFAVEKDPTYGQPYIRADLSNATAATINALREAFQLQRLYERDARGGTRYTEIVRSHFGVVSPDARLQRPEYLGGGSTPVNIHPVAQTSVAASTPQGNLAGFGTVSASGHGFTKSFTEHCVVIGMVSVRADLTYQQGMNRMFSRRTRFDFYWPALAHLGEQEVLSKEIYCDGTSGDNTVFGYQERYAEYRYKPSQITGEFRSVASGSLDAWHLAQDFSSRPTLGPTFIEENPPIDRVIAVPSEPQFLFDSYFNFNCARPMPVYSVPGLIDHF
jgi:hypothetical protein